jgi:hypothetical protein
MFTDENSELFSGLSLADALRSQTLKVKGQVHSMSSDEFRSRPDERLVDRVVASLDIQSLVFQLESRETDTQMIMLSRSEPGYRITVKIPYSGERRLWFLKPIDHNGQSPRGQVNANGQGTGGVLRLIAQRSSHLDLDPLNEVIEREIIAIKNLVSRQEEEIKAWRIQLAAAARQEVIQRREILGEAPVVVDSAPPLEREESAPAVPSTNPDLGEDAASEIDISPIALGPGETTETRKGRKGARTTPVEVVKDASAIFNAVSQIYSQHSDEELRTVLLAHLNQLASGSSSNPTFVHLGKTNFMLPGANGAKLTPFVGGCTTWRGPAALKKKCDQLLTRSGGKNPAVVLVVFIRKSGDFGRVLEKVPQSLRKHPRFHHEVASKCDVECEAVMLSPADGETAIALHALSVNLPNSTD